MTAGGGEVGPRPRDLADRLPGVGVVGSLLVGIVVFRRRRDGLSRAAGSAAGPRAAAGHRHRRPGRRASPRRATPASGRRSACRPGSPGCCSAGRCRHDVPPRSASSPPPDPRVDGGPRRPARPSVDARPPSAHRALAGERGDEVTTDRRRRPRAGDGRSPTRRRTASGRGGCCAWAVGAAVPRRGRRLRACSTAGSASPASTRSRASALAIGFGMFAVHGRPAGRQAAAQRASAGSWPAPACSSASPPTGDAYAAWVMTTRGRARRPRRPRRLGAELVLAAAALAGLRRPAAAVPRRPAAVPRGGGCRPRSGAVGAAGSVVLGMLTDTLTGQDVDYRIDNPIGIDGLAGVEEQARSSRCSARLLVRRRRSTAVAAVVVRFRRSRGRRAAADEVVPLRRRPAGPAARPRRCCRRCVGGLVLVWVLHRAAGRRRDRRAALPARRHRRRHQPHAGLRRADRRRSSAIYVLVVGYLGAALRREDDLLDLAGGHRRRRGALRPAARPAAAGGEPAALRPARRALRRALPAGRTAGEHAGARRRAARRSSPTVRESLRLPYAAIALDDGGSPSTSGEPVAAHRARCRCSTRIGRSASSSLGLRPGEDALLPRRPAAARRPRPPGRASPSRPSG